MDPNCSLLSDLLVQCSSQIGAIQTTLDSLNTTIASDADQITSLTAQLSDLTTQLQTLKAQQANVAPITPLLVQYRELQKQTGWILAGGSAGNTGQTGSTGSGTFTPNPDGSATVTIQPNGAYYDAFFYRKLDVTPNPALGLCVYHAEFLLDAANFPLSQCLEMDGSFYSGAYRYQPALQIQMSNKHVRYYDPGSATTKPDWKDTGVVCNIQPGVWEAIEVHCRIDKTTLTYLGVVVDGQFHPLNIVVNAKPKATSTPFAEASVQLDSKSSAAPYKALVNHVGLLWL